MKKFYFEDYCGVSDSNPPIKGKVSVYKDEQRIFSGNNLVVKSGRRFIIDKVLENLVFFYSSSDVATSPDMGYLNNDIIDWLAGGTDQPKTIKIQKDIDTAGDPNTAIARINEDLSVTLTITIQPEASDPMIIRSVGTCIGPHDGTTTAHHTLFSRIVVDPIPLTSGDPITVIYKLYF